MLLESLLPGMDFVERFELSKKELECLIPFLRRDYTVSELSFFIRKNTKTTYRIIQRLRAKKLLILRGNDGETNRIYRFNIDILE